MHKNDYCFCAFYFYIKYRFLLTDTRKGCIIKVQNKWSGQTRKVRQLWKITFYIKLSAKLKLGAEFKRFAITKFLNRSKPQNSIATQSKTAKLFTKNVFMTQNVALFAFILLVTRNKKMKKVFTKKVLWLNGMTKTTLGILLILCLVITRELLITHTIYQQKEF